MVTTKLMTAEDLEAMSSGSYRYELIRGELHRMSLTGFRHAAIVRRIAVPLALYVEQHNLGEVLVGDPGFVLARDPDSVLGPDIAFVRVDHVPPEDEQPRFMRGAPDLAIEVVSPSDGRGEIAEKLAIYRAAGVPLVWVCDPGRRVVRVHTTSGPPTELGADQVLNGGEVIPGFQLRLASIFRDVSS